MKPKFGTSSDGAKQFLGNGIINYGEPIAKILNDANQLVEQTKNSRNNTHPVTLLLHGDKVQ